MAVNENKTRVVIVDDEPIAREGIRTQLAREPSVEIIAECGDGLEAVETIRELAPDLLFLDVQMPGMSGFEVMETVGLDVVPAVIFVTAYDKYALRAFEVHALDYLLKPYTNERLNRLLNESAANPS